MLVALTRAVSPAIANCELEFLDRQPIDFGLAEEQHRQYQKCLAELGAHVEILPAEADLPDSQAAEADLPDSRAGVAGSASRRAGEVRLFHTFAARAGRPDRYAARSRP